MLLVAKIDQRIEIFNCFDNDRATTSAITTIRTAKFDIFLTPKADASSTAIAAFNIYLLLV